MFDYYRYSCSTKFSSAREIQLSDVVSGEREALTQWRGLVGVPAEVLMSSTWCPVREAEEGEVIHSGILSFTVLSVISQSGIVPVIELKLKDREGVQSRHSWISKALGPIKKATHFGLGAPRKTDFDLSLHGGGMFRFSGDQKELEVSVRDKLTEKVWSKTLTLLKLSKEESPFSITLDQKTPGITTVSIQLKYKFYSES